MFSTLATLVLLSFLLLLGVILLVWSLLAFGTGPKAVSMPWGKNAKPEELTHNPFIKKNDAGPSELAPDHISRGQLRTVKKPVSDASLAEIKAITEEKVEKPVKTTTYEQMVKRAKHPTVPPTKAKDPKLTQTQVSNDQLRGAHAAKRSDTAIDETSKKDSVIEIPNDVPPFIQVSDLKGFPPLPPAPIKSGITHSSKDTPVTKLPNLPAKPVPPIPKPEGLTEPLPEKKLWPAPLAPMVPKPALNAEAKPITPQPVSSPLEIEDVLTLKPEAVPKAQSRKLNDDPFDKFSKDKKDDTLF